MPPPQHRNVLPKAELYTGYLLLFMLQRLTDPKSTGFPGRLLFTHWEHKQKTPGALHEGTREELQLLGLLWSRGAAADAPLPRRAAVHAHVCAELRLWR